MAPMCWGFGETTGSTAIHWDLEACRGPVNPYQIETILVVEFPGLSDVVLTDISTGNSHTCAILDNGSVACWGYGETGSLGHGSYESSSRPVLASLPAGMSASDLLWRAYKHAIMKTLQ